MSGHVFPCTPCGFDHAGECEVLPCNCKGMCKGHVDQSPPPSEFDCKGGCGRRTSNVTGTCLSCRKSATKPPTPPQTTPGWTATITAGSRWRLEHQYPGDPNWYNVGYSPGYEVMAIVANQAGGCAIQMREWQAPNYPVYTCSLKWWDPDGNGASDGGFNRFVPWT